MVNKHILDIGDLKLEFIKLRFQDSILNSFFHDSVVDCLNGIVPSVLHVNDVPNQLWNLIVFVKNFLEDFLDINISFVVLFQYLCRVIAFQGPS